RLRGRQKDHVARSSSNVFNCTRTASKASKSPDSKGSRVLTRDVGQPRLFEERSVRQENQTRAHQGANSSQPLFGQNHSFQPNAEFERAAKCLSRDRLLRLS